MKNWYGLIKILEIQHVRDGKVIWEDKNILNTLHVGGELFMLTTCFDNDGSYPPANLYLGMDLRPAITVDDIMDDLVDEPTGNGYLRQSVSTNGGFTVDLVSGVYRATSQVVTFTGTGSGYGPVRNLFMATTSDTSGILIASNAFSSALTINGGDAINMRMGLSLQDQSA